MDPNTYFAELILPIPVGKTFTYRIPRELEGELREGVRVVVPFGRRKVYAAVVRELHQRVPKQYQAKYILAVLDEQPILHPQQLKLWDWISHYYICHLGEVMNAALPSVLKLSSESQICLSPQLEAMPAGANEREQILLQTLTRKTHLSFSEAAKLTEMKKIYPLIKGMVEKGWLLVEESLNEKYVERKEKRLRLAPAYQQQEAMIQLFEALEKRAYKQLEVLMRFLELSRKQGLPPDEAYVSRKKLLSYFDSAASPLKALEDKGVLMGYEVSVSRLKRQKATAQVDDIVLSAHQARAWQEIQQQWHDKRVCLLHGVTASGKTEIYIKAIEQALQAGKQVLYLLPEIALTEQIINRLRKYFGVKVGIYHSRYNPHERLEIWHQVLGHQQTEGYQIILSARSGIFLPFSRLGLVIVDEEHDTSYKQFDPAPRYHARDMALVLAQMHQAKVLLGSATPSVETYFHAQKGRYGYVSLLQRYGQGQMPEVLLTDLRHETKQQSMQGSFSSFLLQHVKEALEKKEQVILFQNRRGFAPRMECQQCQWIPECPNCDISLVYHKEAKRLRCHICGYSTHLYHQCPECSSPDIDMKGFGTERLEEDLALILPEARIKRLDLDTTRQKNAYQSIFSDFANRQIDILIGTQMVTKGLDFDNVSVVGVLSADNMINFPDFRAFERSFQMMVQVSGRAGRKDKKGKVIVQSYNPYHPVLKQVRENHYLGMFNMQIQERYDFKYPPYYRLIRFSLKDKDYQQLNRAADIFFRGLLQHFGQERLFGPQYPMVSRIRNFYIKDILLKMERGISQNEVRTRLQQVIDGFHAQKQYQATRLVIDVDPY